MSEDEQSAKCWQKALDSLPSSNLTAAELAQQTQYKAELKAIKTRIEQLKQTVVTQ